MMFERHLKPATVGHLPVERSTCALASFEPSGRRRNGANITVTNISGEQRRSDFSRRLN